MATIRRVLTLTILCFYLAGCSGYRTVDLGDSDPQGTRDQEVLEAAMALGQDIRVTVSSGQKYSGVVDSLDDEELKLKQGTAGRYSMAFIPRSEIEVIEIKEADEAATGFLVVGVLAVVTIGAVTANEMSKMNDMFGN